MSELTTYEAIREAYLDGELGLAACAEQLAQLQLTALESREWDLLAAVETGLLRAAQAESQAPWLALKVESELMLQERASRWLSEHPRGLLGISGICASQTEMCKWLVQTTAAIGGACGAALACWLALPFVPPSGIQFDPVLFAAGLGGLLSLAALRWPELHSYYTS